jgi:hypothetical protein
MAACWWAAPSASTTAIPAGPTGTPCGASSAKPRELLRCRRGLLPFLPQGPGVEPNAGADLSALRAIGSTGSPLPPRRLPVDLRPQSTGSDIWLNPISGGTDFAGCLRRRRADAAGGLGEMQCRCLGASRRGLRRRRAGPAADRRGRRTGLHRADAVDAAVFLGRPGGRATARATSTCTPASGATATGSASRRAGGAIIYGRSDATINRHGIRMGTASCTARWRPCPRCWTAWWSTWNTWAARATCRCSWCCARATN